MPSNTTQTKQHFQTLCWEMIYLSLTKHSVAHRPINFKVNCCVFSFKSDNIKEKWKGNYAAEFKALWTFRKTNVNEISN